ARADLVAVVGANRPVDARRDLGLHLRGEGNRARLAGLEIDALEPAADRDDERPAVGHEVVARERVAAGARLLIVARDRRNQPPFGAGLEVADAERGLG